MAWFLFNCQTSYQQQWYQYQIKCCSTSDIIHINKWELYQPMQSDEYHVVEEEGIKSISYLILE